MARYHRPARALASVGLNGSPVSPAILIYLVILVAAFYFLIVRPQRRNAMIRRQLLSAVQVGDEIVSTGGVYGTVVAIEDDTLDVEIAPGVVVKLARGAVGARITPESEYDDEDYEDEDADDGADDDEWEGDLDEVDEREDGDSKS
jgi:preprotein translocase subunit YajC